MHGRDKEGVRGGFVRFFFGFGRGGDRWMAAVTSLETESSRGRG